MAKAGVSFEVRGYEKLGREIIKLEKQIRNPEKAYRESKMIMLQDVDRHFISQSGPQGKWEALKPWTLRKRRGGGAKILQDTGRLKGSITGIYDRWGVVVGTNINYALQHQFGDTSKHIPRREFLYLNESAQQRILDRFIIQLRG